MQKLFAALVAGSLLVACSSHDKETAPQPQTTYVPTRLAHEFYSSWGHDGRGGAALRKPAYQHVMGSEDVIMTTHGNYHDLQVAPDGRGPKDSVAVTAVTYGMGRAIDQALAFSPPAASAPASKPVVAGSEAEYLVAYRKFCKGAGMALTEREWELVAKGGPKGVPPSLRGKCLQTK